MGDVTTNAGCRVITLPHEGGEIRLLVTYPSRSEERSERVGPYFLDVALDAPVTEGVFPLVVVSHGSGGSGLTHRNLARYLALHGFVVVLPEHPGNNRDDNSLAGTHTLLENRPRELTRVIDWACADELLGPHLIPHGVGLIGHSLGGYTALALAGGRPWAAAHETTDGCPRAVSVAPDPRVKSLVLLAPATPWFQAPGALQEVRVPILMLTGEKDTMTPGWHADLVKRGVPRETVVEHHVVRNAGHFSFLSAFPPERTHPSFPPSQDPAGFDRVRFHEAMYPEIAAFLRRTVARPA